MRYIITLFLLVFSTPCLGQTGAIQGSPPTKADALDSSVFRLGIPKIVRGPGNDFGDEPMTFVKSGKKFYIYGSGQIGWAATSSSMTSGYGGGEGQPTCHTPGGTTITVRGTQDTFCSHLALAFGVPGDHITAVTGHNTDACGDWANASYHNPYDGLWYMLVHNEGPCLYHADVGSTDESMSMWTSKSGKPGTWKPMTVPGLSSGTIISSDEAYEAKWMVGPGDCTMVPDAPKYPKFMYMMCGFYSDNGISDYKNIIARAPVKFMGPGNWKFYYHGCYCVEALNNHYDPVSQKPDADMFNWVGAYTSTIPGKFPLMTLAWGHVIQPINDTATNIESTSGFTLSVSYDLKKPEFHTLAVPLLNYDRQDFAGRPVPYDGYFYQIFRNDTDGSSILDEDHFNLWYVWVAPNNSLSYRYIVQVPVTVTQRSPAQIRAGYPQVGVALETYHNVSSGKTYSGRLRSTTVSPFAGITGDGATEEGWQPSVRLGYMLTACPIHANSATINRCDAVGAAVSNQIEECWSARNNDYQLHIDENGKAGSCPTGWTHVRSVGWLYKTAPPAFPTKPIFSCLNVDDDSHFASNRPDCDGKKVLDFLGYAPST